MADCDDGESVTAAAETVFIGEVGTDHGAEDVADGEGVGVEGGDLVEESELVDV